MKKLGIIIGSVFALLIATIVVVPLVVDVNQYNPQIVKAVNERINGNLELGKLSLSLWGRIRIGVDGLSLKDIQGNSVVSVKDASFDLPYSSVFSGAPLITLRMVQPDLQVLKSKDGKLNVLGLMKSAEVAGEVKKEESSAGAVALPAMAVNSHVGVSIENARLVYKDQGMGLTNTIDQLNLRVKDFSLSRKTEMELWADLKTKMGDLTVEGPLKLIADLTPEVSGGEFKSAKVNAIFTADDLEIQKGALFFKKKGIPTNFQFNGAMDTSKLNLERAAMKFHNAEIVVTGSYDKVSGADIRFEAKRIDLKPWSDLIPMLKAFELEGGLAMKGDVKGTPDAIQYHADIKATNFAMKGPMLKAKPVINADIMIATDRVEQFLVDLKGPGNEVILKGKLVSFSKPQLNFALTSPKGMDLDQWIEFPKTKAPSASAKSSSESKSGTDQVDFDAMVDPIRKNEMMKSMVIDGSVSIAFIKAMNVRIDDLVAKIQMKNLVTSLTGLKMKMYSGSVAGAFTTDLKPADPQYNMSLAVNGVDLQKAIESQFQSFKDTMVGTLSMNMQGSGMSFNADEIKKKLQLKGDFKVGNAMFKTIDVARMANAAITDAIQQIGSKVPAVQGKKVSIPGDKDTRYETVSSRFTLSNGVMEAPDFYAKAAPKSGVDIKGYTRLGLVDESLDAKWELIDAQHLIEPLNVSIGSQSVVNVLAKGEKDPIILPITVGCKWTSPCPSYTSTAEYLAGVTAGRVAKAAGEEVKAKAKSAVEDAVKKAIGGGSPFKGLFGR
jgi:AsmA protein